MRNVELEISESDAVLTDLRQAERSRRGFTMPRLVSSLRQRLIGTRCYLLGGEKTDFISFFFPFVFLSPTMTLFKTLAS